MAKMSSSFSISSNIGVLSVLIFVFLPWTSSSSSWCATQFLLEKDRKFEQKTDIFWEYEEESKSWVELELPYHLFTCVNDMCSKATSIASNKAKKDDVKKKKEYVLPLRKRLISLRKMSDTSIWVTGQSGSIYERFWNGIKWVIAAHDLQPSAGAAKSVFVVNQTILALSEPGYLYQMQLNENTQPIWVDFSPTIDLINTKQGSIIPLKSGVISYDAQKIYFNTNNGSLLELTEVEPPRWLNHDRPPGANVAAIADAGTIRPDVIFTISSSGDLYEYDRSTKPSWKKHIWTEIAKNANSILMPLTGSVITDHGLNSVSLFLLTKEGNLVERRLIQRKWKWAVHEVPEDEQLLSITKVVENESNEKPSSSLFFTSLSGNVWEYKVPRYTGYVRDSQTVDSWVNHMHPEHTKIATCHASGLQFQVGRIFFPLDDGRLAELHHTGLGGETMGPTNQNIRKRGSVRTRYIWSVLDAPETEGWNADYCTEEHGPTNCIMGINDELSMTSRGRNGHLEHNSYLIPSHSATTSIQEKETDLEDNLINKNFRLRVMHRGKSFFLVTESGATFEYLSTEQNVWLWLRHEHEFSAMRGAVGDYNGSLFLVDEYGSLLMRERNGNKLTWLNCTAMKKGKRIIGGSPWNNYYLDKGLKVTADDSLFFVSKAGRLLQFIVALRKFKWKDRKHPRTTKIASIVDQEGFRDNIVFVIGRNNRLYQYNKVTDIWHEHRQSQHLVLSTLPGTAMRPSSQSSTGSLFMLTEEGGLVEYHWDGSQKGWNWVEHGKPHRAVSLVGSTGPSFHGDQLFLIGSDGYVYLRYLEHATWIWKNYGGPYIPCKSLNDENGDICLGDDNLVGNNWEVAVKGQDNDNLDCDSKVAPIRPIPFSDDSVIFELRDGRLAEMQQKENGDWVWSRTIGTPTSLCISHFWTGLAS